MTRFLLALGTASALLTPSSPGLAQQANPAVRPDLTGELSSLAPEALYQGWRSRQLMGQTVSGLGAKRFGSVRDIIDDVDGRIAGLILEGGGSRDGSDALSRIPWSEVNLTPGQDGVSVQAPDGRQPSYGLFPGSEGVTTLPREFRVTEVMGDYARLQSGYGWGYVSDVVFTRDGRLVAVLVNREASAGGGAFAFPFRGIDSPWDPGWSYYGLPFATANQAEAAGLRVDPRRFNEGTL